MFTQSVVVPNKTGLHARPASDLAKECKEYDSLIELVYGDTIINAKSIISLLSGGLKQYTEILVQVTGEDEQVAGPAVVEFIKNLKG